MNQFTVTAQVTFINELHLDRKAMECLQVLGKAPDRDDIVDQNLVSDSEILIFRVSIGFRKAFPANHFNNQQIVLKSIYK